MKNYTKIGNIVNVFLQRDSGRNRLFVKSFMFCFLFLISFTCFAASDLEVKAENAYANKKYKEAITIYEDILKSGLSSYKLYYNLGNAYYKNNELGRAIYHYELAHKIKPNNQDINTNLRIANEKTIDDIDSKENFFISAIKSGLVNILTTTGWAWLSIISLSSSFILFLLFYISQTPIIKRIGFFLSVIVFFIFISSMSLGYSAVNYKQQTTFAIILSKESKVFEEPNPVNDSKFILHEGSKVKVLESNAEWTNIKLENGNEGWLKTKDVGLF